MPVISAFRKQKYEDQMVIIVIFGYVASLGQPRLHVSVSQREREGGGESKERKRNLKS